MFKLILFLSFVTFVLCEEEKSAVREAIDTIKDGATKIKDGAVNAVKHSVEKVKNAARYGVELACHAFISAEEKVKELMNKLKSKTARAKQHVKDIFHKSHDEKNFDVPFDSHEKIIEEQHFQDLNEQKTSTD